MSEATDPADDSPRPSGSDSMAGAPRRRRSPIIDVAVVALGGYLLYWMFGDVRYFLQGSEPQDLGDAAAFVDKGLPGDLDDTYVVLRGTPDVQHAARLRLEPKGGGSGRTIGYLRIIEGGGSLFAAIPRTTEAAPQQFEGVFEGRIRRLADSPNFAAIQQHFDGERIVEERDATPAALLDALGKRQGDALTVVDTGGESLALGTKATVTLVVEQPDVQVQLGAAASTRRRPRRRPWPRSASPTTRRRSRAAAASTASTCASPPASVSRRRPSCRSRRSSPRAPSRPTRAWAR
ncbi:hypothetical protein OV079_34930 [Nannocystis pusilla]|uniref:Uncharacterized protein n=1 Tax=Nannocystis pusilla TaxID=889268 RepID=A0A9X3EV03_9BACT|nr:hypothetical protein [Nannocystis pusilla]MCY1010672.1 hypothetical protein [Nannocystis pusilla]